MKDMVKGIQQKIDQIEAEISKLYGDRKVLLESIEIFGGAAEISPVEESKEYKTPAKVKPATVKADKTGKVKFLPYIREILQSNPGKEYEIKQVCAIAQKAIEKGLITSGAKKVNDAVCAGLCSLAGRGIISKFKGEYGRNIYVYNGTPKSKKQIKEETEIPPFNNNLLQEAILSVTKDHSYTPEELTQRIRTGNDFLEISKNLNGTLKDSVLSEIKILIEQNMLDQDISSNKIININ
jgi:hypothetical protein